MDYGTSQLALLSIREAAEPLRKGKHGAAIDSLQRIGLLLEYGPN
jgi:hypothetical protein